MTEPGPPAPRLPLVDAPHDPLARDYFAGLASSQRRILNLHRMMAHAPALMKASGDMASAFRGDIMLARALVELVVLRTAQVTDCDYIWTRHLDLARACGVTERQIAAISRWPQDAAFTPAQKAALGFAETIAAGKPVADADFALLRRDFSPREIVELTMLVGFYVSTAIFIKSLAVPAET